ncbi:MAG TPA: three-Cys-motif partner protein TcmP [Chloroflexia bacterium]|nr:three-Cys-motif partner protein TcmP [Chloroflexia bacterium]
MVQKENLQQFGGDWTAEKLTHIRKYLAAYVTALKRQNFETIYVDAFAGTGYNTVKTDSSQLDTVLSNLTENDNQKFLDGSARIALQVQPMFNKYVFIEKSQSRFVELEKLKAEFPDKAARIELVREDANIFIRRFCSSMRQNQRAVIFLDPFGMQVSWETIQSIAATKKIDLWYLFPSGIGVNRMLKRDGNISESWKLKLNNIFGTDSWFEAFYLPNPQLSMFGDSGVVKDADQNSIKDYLIERLQTIFSQVAKNPLLLSNSKGSPLYLLCFAAEHPLALKIAGDILRK